MTEDILRRLGFEAASKQERPYIAEDFVFDAARYPSARALRVAHEELMLHETPLALVREIHLEPSERRHAAMRLSLALCWNGFRDAMSVLGRFPSRFQRAFLETAVVNAAERYGTGDFGLAWSWSDAGEVDVLAFVLNNVLVTLEGHEAGPIVRALAQELAGALRNLRTGGPYAEAPSGPLGQAGRRAGDPPRLRPGGTLDLGVLGEEGTNLFFLTSSGAVNRSRDRSDAWYYRAGAENGRQQITLFRVGKGILPVMERLAVEID